MAFRPRHLSARVAVVIALLGVALAACLAIPLRRDPDPGAPPDIDDATIDAIRSALGCESKAPEHECLYLDWFRQEAGPIEFRAFGGQPWLTAVSIYGSRRGGYGKAYPSSEDVILSTALDKEHWIGGYAIRYLDRNERDAQGPKGHGGEVVALRPLATKGSRGERFSVLLADIGEIHSLMSRRERPHAANSMVADAKRDEFDDGSFRPAWMTAGKSLAFETAWGLAFARMHRLGVTFLVVTPRAGEAVPDFVVGRTAWPLPPDAREQYRAPDAMP